MERWVFFCLPLKSAPFFKAVSRKKGVLKEVLGNRCAGGFFANRGNAYVRAGETTEIKKMGKIKIIMIIGAGRL